jgi:hypothetical protein
VSGHKRGRLLSLDDGLVYVIRYLRVSGKEQKDKGLSIPTQDSETTKYMLARSADGWIEDSRYEDVLQGTRDDRVGYQAALARLRELHRQRKRAVVVVFKTDRFGRRLAERADCWDEFQRLGVELHSVYEGGKQDRLGHNVRALLSEEEVMTLRDRVTGYRRFVIERGWRPPGRAAWGYTWREATDTERSRGAPKQVMIADPSSAAYVAEAWRMRAAGNSVHAVSVWIAGLPSEIRGGRTFDYSMTRAMFDAPVYIARHDIGDVDVLARPRGNWASLVDDATWTAAHERADEGRRVPSQASARYLLTGLLRCWRCGHRMDGRSFVPKASRERGTDRRRRTYRCISRMRGGAAGAIVCMAEAPTATIERLVLERLSPVLVALGQPETLAKLEAYETRMVAHDAESTHALAGRLGAETARLNRARSALAMAGTARLLHEMSDYEYDVIREHNMAEVQAATAALSELRQRAPQAVPPALAAVLGRVPDLVAALEQTENVASARAALGQLIEMVVPVPSGQKWSRQWRVEMELTPLGRALVEAMQALEECPVGELGKPNYQTACSFDAPLAVASEMLVSS